MENPRPEGHPPVRTGAVGVLIVNLGTPDAPTAQAVRRYLAEFLSDGRVVDLPRALWLPILHGVILNVRPARSAKAYAKIWTREGSPLRLHTKEAAEALAERLAGAARVDFAMRYGAPSIRQRIDAMLNAGADRLLIVPMYPQYSQATSASVADAAFDALKAMKRQPALRIAAPYYDDPDHIGALKASASAFLSALGFAPERVILSFHGAPKRHLDGGDPYYCHCAKTARLLRAAMGWTEDFAPLAFQSKFGREEWLTPATDQTIRDLGEAARFVDVVRERFFAIDRLLYQQCGQSGIRMRVLRRADDHRVDLAPFEHPGVHSGVAGPLTHQNFLVVPAGAACPGAPAPTCSW